MQTIRQFLLRRLAGVLALCMLISLLLPVAAAAPSPEPGITLEPQSNVPEGLEYRIVYDTDTYVEITKYTGSAQILVIPETIQGFPVTRIAEYSFYSYEDNTSLREIYIPATVEYISTFWHFNFCGYPNLVALHVDPANINYRSFDGVLFARDGKTIIYCPPAKTGHYAIPNGVTTVGSAFSNSALTSVYIPDSVTTLKGSAFSRSQISQVRLSENVTSIERLVFSGCDRLEGITLPYGVTKIGESAFASCSNLEYVAIPASVTEIAYRAFANCENMSDIYYAGTEDEWSGITIHDTDQYGLCSYPNEWLTTVQFHYNSNGPGIPDLPGPTGSSTLPNTSIPNNGTYMSPQESVWYNIWCAGVSRFNAEKYFNLNVGDNTYPTGDSWKARGNIPDELADQVSVSKEGWITCPIPRELVYTCREVVLYPDTQKDPFAQFVAARNNGDSMYTNLSCSHLSVYENAMRTYDMYVDINWNGYTPGKIYLKQGDRALELQEGQNQGLLLGMFSASGGDLLLCWETADGTVYSQKMYLDIYKNSTSNMKLDSGESISGTNPASEVEDEMWGGLSFSMDLFNDSVPVELELSPTGLNKGTFKGTIGVKIENADDKKTVIELLDTNLNKKWDYWTFDSLKNTLNAKYPDTLIPQQATSFVISADTQLIGVVEGTYELGADGSLADMQLTDSKILSSVDGTFSVTRQHLVTPVPWYWTLEFKAGFELALELQNEYDGTAASIAPLNSEVNVGIGAKAAVGVSGAASVGVKGGGNVYVTGQVLPIDFSKTEIYSVYDISLYGEFGPFKGDIFPYKSDKYYIWKDGKWVFSTDPSDNGGGGGGFRDSAPDNGFEMQQISRDYLNNATLFNDVHSVQLNSVADASVENLVKANTYTFTEPQIVGVDNGNLLLVWVDDPGVAVRPVDINRAALFYSVYDGSTWSEPSMISDDGTADASPILKNIDGNVYLLWTNANAVFDEATDYEEYCASLDIAYAKFDAASAAFTDVTVIDTNESCDILPDMTFVNGVPTVVWIQNDANDPFQSSGSNKLYAASQKAGSWIVTVLADNLMVVDGLAVTCSDDVLDVYISQDTDGDTSTVEDRELFKVSENTVSQVTDNDTADLKPTLIDDSLYWYQNGMLTDGTQTVPLAEETDRYVTAGNGTDSAVLYQRFNEDDSVTICANILHDSVWSDVVELVTIDCYLQKFDAVMADDGSITIITNEVELTDNVYQQADLCSYVFGQECDIAVQQVYLNPLSMAPGGEMELFATLKNMGTAGTSNVYARIYDGENLLKEELLPVELEAGSEVTVILTYPLEETFDSESLHIEFWPESVVDGNENNTADCEIPYADVSVEELTAIQGNGTTQVSAYISNRGLTELVDVDVILYTKVGDEKKVIGSYTIPSLAVAMGEAVTFDAALEIDTVVYVEAVVADEEFNLGNNVEFTLVTAASGVLDTATHDHVFSSYVSDGNATCTEDGTMTAKCDLCDTTDTVPDVGSALGHDMSEWETVTAATCTQNGEEHRTCARCDHCEKRTLAATGHNYEAVVTAPTCTERGYTTYTCKCGESYVADYVAALGHSFGDWAVIQEPTTTEDGLEERSCTRCGHAEQRSIAKLENPFSDVVPGSFYYEPVMWAVENGTTNGTSATTFSPGDPCMRAHVVTFLWRAVGSPEPTRTDDPFVDVKPGDFYYKPVLWALENGITNGTSATTFGPSSYCNRAQVVTFLYRSLGSPALESAENPFTDVAKGSFYERAVLWAVKNGITNGTSATTFAPGAICNRAQIVTFLYRAFVD